MVALSSMRDWAVTLGLRVTPARARAVLTLDSTDLLSSHTVYICDNNLMQNPQNTSNSSSGSCFIFFPRWVLSPEPDGCCNLPSTQQSAVCNWRQLALKFVQNKIWNGFRRAQSSCMEMGHISEKLKRCSG